VEILRVFADLSYPVATNVLPREQERAALDQLVATAIGIGTGIDPQNLLSDTYAALTEWIEARQP